MSLFRSILIVVALSALMVSNTVSGFMLKPNMLHCESGSGASVGSGVSEGKRRPPVLGDYLSRLEGSSEPLARLLEELRLRIREFEWNGKEHKQILAVQEALLKRSRAIEDAKPNHGEDDDSNIGSMVNVSDGPGYYM